MFMYQDKFKTNYIFGNLFRSLSVSESPIVVVSQACKDDPSTSHRKSAGLLKHRGPKLISP